MLGDLLFTIGVGGLFLFGLITMVVVGLIEIFDGSVLFGLGMLLVTGLFGCLVVGVALQ
jgi:hypothetical protein